jgi:hypothetical protein
LENYPVKHFTFFFALFLWCFTQVAEADVTCASIQGEFFVAACPAVNAAYKTVKIYQAGCTGVGYQTRNYSARGALVSTSAVTWDVVGAGRLLDKEDATYDYVKDRFFSGNTLYNYNFKVEISSGISKLQNVEMLVVLDEGSLYANYAGIALNSTLYQLNACRPR